MSCTNLTLMISMRPVEIKKISLLFLIVTLLAGCKDDDDSVTVPLSITSFSPTSGVPGDLVTIVGTGFSDDASENKVRFNGSLGTVYSTSETELTVVVPSEASSGTISITVDSQVVTSEEAFVVTTSES